jgi:serralysin
VSAISAAFAAWEAVADLHFVKVGDTNGQEQHQSTADLAIALSPEGGAIAGLGIFPDPAFADELLASLGYSRNSGEFPVPRPEGDIVFDPSVSLFSSLAAGSSGFEVLLHEIGHALGLKHPEDDGGNGRPITDARTGGQTLMQDDVAFDLPVAATPMLYDILTIQHIYGASLSYHTGDDSYALANAHWAAIWDAGGIDTIDATSWPGTEGVAIDLRAGRSSGVREGEKTTAIAYGVTIENAVGTASNDLLLGNGAANDLKGGAGDDSLDGGGGVDTMTGGAGDDVFHANHTGDVVLEAAGEGDDRVIASTTFVLGAGIERLELAGDRNVHATGNAEHNSITGNAGANRLAGGAGIDYLAGGAGNDVYVLEDEGALPDTYLYVRGEAGDWVSGGGTIFIEPTFLNVQLMDWSFDDDVNAMNFMRVSIASADHNWYLDFSTHKLGHALQPGVYSDAMRASFPAPGHPGLDVSGDGHGSNELTGSFVITEIEYSGTTLLSAHISFEQHSDGAAPGLFGTLSINSAPAPVVDSIAELRGGGLDTVRSAHSHVLEANVERLVLTGSGAIDGIGNASANHITGNAQANRLDGAAAADTLAGGLGNDTLIGGRGADSLVGGSGADTLVWDPSDVLVAGGVGADRLKLGGTLALDLGAASTLSGIERIQLAGANTLRLGAQDLLDLSPSTNTLFVDGGADDALRLAGDWTQGATAGGYVSYVSGAAILRLDADITDVQLI